MDYAEILLQAVDTVVNERISNLPFDKTVICTVIDNSKKDQGIYTLSYEATTFEAYSDKTNYSKDAQVLVVIPEGNWGARKQIIARYVEPNEAIPVKYVSPLEEIVAGTDVTFTLEESFGIAANDDRLKVGSIGTAGKPGYMKLIHSWQNLNINTSNLNYLGLSVDFKTLFENLSIVSGDYGLIIEINYNDNTKSIFDFNSSKDFFGNVYGYFGWTTQEQAYELTQNKTIVGMNCYLFHYDEIKYKKESDGTAEKLEPIPLTDGNFYKNILIQNLNIFFGKLKSEAYKREVILRSDKDTFKKGSNIVNLTFEWINLDGFDDGFFGEASSDPDNKPNKYEVYWYLDDATGNFQDTSASFT